MSKLLVTIVFYRAWKNKIDNILNLTKMLTDGIYILRILFGILIAIESLTLSFNQKTPIQQQTRMHWWDELNILYNAEINVIF